MFPALVTDDMPPRASKFTSLEPVTILSTKIYLASRYDRLHEMQGYRDLLQGAGYAVTSRWVSGEHEMKEHHDFQHKYPECNIAFAVEDLEDVIRSDWVISFTEPLESPTRRGGRHVELGIAIGYKKRLIVIGHRENVFHYLPQIEFFRTWEDFWPGA